MLTAAHCMAFEAEDMAVWAGGLDLEHSETGLVIRVAEIFVHNDYNEDTHENDIAIVRVIYF